MEIDYKLIVSIAALVLSILALLRQYLKEKQEKKEILLVNAEFHNLYTKKEKDKTGKNTPYIKVELTNIGLRKVYISDMVIQTSAGLVFFKRLRESYDEFKYPIVLESGERFTTGTKVISAPMQENGMAIGKITMGPGDYYGGNGEGSFSRAQGEDILAHVLITTTRGNKFKSTELSMSEFIEFADTPELGYLLHDIGPIVKD